MDENSTTDISFPPSNSLKSLADFSIVLQDLPEQERLRICVGRKRFLNPTCMIFLAKICRQRSRKFKDEKLSYSGLNHLGYANNLGFSEVLRLKGNPYRQGAFGGQNYIPISAFQLEELQESAWVDGIEIGDILTRKSENIARIVSQERSDELKSVLAKSFCEIFRNTFEHGETDTAVFCAQYWPKLDEVEICIADRGVGVRNSLRQSKHTKPESDEEALHYALMPGVSSKAWKNKKKKAHQKSVWDNAGYGLFFAQNLFGRLGRFFMASGGSSIFLNSESLKTYPCSVEGTLVSMRLKLSDEEAIERTINTTAGLAFEVKQRLGVKSLDYASVAAFLRSGLD